MAEDNIQCLLGSAASRLMLAVRGVDTRGVVGKPLGALHHLAMLTSGVAGEIPEHRPKPLP